MINKEFLASCTDEQINKGIAWIQIAGSVDKAMASENIELYRYGMNYDMSVPRHYCTNPNDIMPIAFANELFVIPCIDGGYMASDGVYDMEIEEIISECNWAHNKNPLRATCEVYILMSVNK